MARAPAQAMSQWLAFEEEEKDGLEKMPVIGADGEEGAEPEFGAAGLIDVEDGQVALAAGSDVEPEARIGQWVSRQRRALPEWLGG